jgi:hypothetical protein
LNADEARPKDETLNRTIVEQLRARSHENRLSCASAFDIAASLSIPASEIGRTANATGVRLSRCQLGFFGYPNKQAWDLVNLEILPVPDGLIAAMQAAQDKTDTVSCAKLWQLAATYRVPRLQVGYLADRLGVHVTPCQLGAF